jgi:hypothetical protein
MYDRNWEQSVETTQQNEEDDYYEQLYSDEEKRDKDWR